MFLSPSVSPSRSPFLTSSPHTALLFWNNSSLWKTPFTVSKATLSNAFFHIHSLFFDMLSVGYFHVVLVRALTAFTLISGLFWKSVGYPEFVTSRGKIIISHCSVSMTNIFIYLINIFISTMAHVIVCMWEQSLTVTNTRRFISRLQFRTALQCFNIFQPTVLVFCSAALLFLFLSLLLPADSCFQQEKPRAGGEQKQS